MEKTSLLLAGLMIIGLMTSCGTGKVSGETFSTEQFSVLVPSGWMVIRATDPFEKGKIREDMVYINKGAKAEIDIFSTPGVSIIYVANRKAKNTLPPPKSFYDDVVDMKPFTLGKYNYEGYTAKFSNKPMTIFWTISDEEYFQFSVNTEIDGKKIAFEDADVQAIIESVQPIKK